MKLWIFDRRIYDSFKLKSKLDNVYMYTLTRKVVITTLYTEPEIMVKHQTFSDHF